LNPIPNRLIRTWVSRFPFRAPYFSETSKEIAGFVGNSRRTGFAYGFFISAPQQHLGLVFAWVEALVTSISQRQFGFRQW